MFSILQRTVIGLSGHINWGWNFAMVDWLDIDNLRFLLLEIVLCQWYSKSPVDYAST